MLIREDKLIVITLKKVNIWVCFFYSVKQVLQVFSAVLTRFVIFRTTLSNLQTDEIKKEKLIK